MKKTIFLLMLYLLFCFDTVNAEGNLLVGKRDVGNRKEPEKEHDTNVSISSFTLEEKVAQLFFITPEALTGVDQVTVAGQATRDAFAAYPVGGVIYFEQNIESREQLTEMLANMQTISLECVGVPAFLAVDEEGGTVTRVYGSNVDGIPYVGDMLSVGLTGDTDQAYQTGKQIGEYLAGLNFNLDFAPVADIFSNPANTVVGSRSFGYEADIVSEMVSAAVRGMKETGVEATLKHFPGHGDTALDSHAGYAAEYKTMEELRACELLPFQAGIEAGAEVVMVGHISLPNILGDLTPSSLSHDIVTGLLREELGFEGVVITDALNMGAIANNYTSGDAAVLAIQAGADMLLMPSDFYSAYYTVLGAVQDGIISEERIDESLIRILNVKEKIL